MKKICMIIFSVALLTSFAACSGAKKEENKVKEAVENAVDTTKAAVAAVKQDVAADVKPDDAIKAFKAFAKEYGDAFNNITKDPVKFTTLAGKLNDQLAVINKIKSSFTKKQQADFDAAMKIINDVNSAAAGKK